MWEQEKASATHLASTEHPARASIQCAIHSDLEKVPHLAGATKLGNRSFCCLPVEEEGTTTWVVKGILITQVRAEQGLEGKLDFQMDYVAGGLSGED